MKAKHSKHSIILSPCSKLPKQKHTAREQLVASEIWLGTVLISTSRNPLPDSDTWKITKRRHVQYYGVCTSEYMLNLCQCRDVVKHQGQHHVTYLFAALSAHPPGCPSTALSSSIFPTLTLSGLIQCFKCKCEAYWRRSRYALAQKEYLRRRGSGTSQIRSWKRRRKH